MTIPRRDISAMVAGNAGRTVLNLFSPPEWTVDALCREVGPDIFFPEEKGDDGGKGSGYALDAKRVCALCPVRQECLDYALAYESGAMGTPTSYSAAGVYGGLTPRERIRLLRDRRTRTDQEAS